MPFLGLVRSWNVFFLTEPARVASDSESSSDEDHSTVSFVSGEQQLSFFVLWQAEPCSGFPAKPPFLEAGGVDQNHSQPIFLLASELLREVENKRDTRT